MDLDIIYKADTLMENKEVEKAINLIEASLTTAEPELELTIAEWFKEWGFLNESNKILEKLMAKYPDELELQSILIDNYIELGEDDEAFKILDQHTKIDHQDPNYLEVILQQADLYQAQGLFEVSETKLLEAKKHFPNEEVLDIALAELLFSIGEFKGAIGYYDKLKKNHNEFANISIVNRLAESYAAIGEQEQALQLYDQQENKQVDDLFKYGLAAFQAGRKDIAINAWKEVLEIDSDYYSVYSLLTDAYEDEKLLEEAYETAIAGLKVDEYNKELYLQVGILSLKLQKDNEAEQYIREAIALDPDYKEAILQLISVLKDQDRYDDIIELLSSVKEFGAEDSLYEWELAKAFVEIEEYNEALFYYDGAYDELKDDVEFLKEYGYFLIEEGNRTKAITVLKRYIQLEPLDIETESYLNRISEM